MSTVRLDTKAWGFCFATKHIQIVEAVNGGYKKLQKNITKGNEVDLKFECAERSCRALFSVKPLRANDKNSPIACYGSSRHNNQCPILADVPMLGYLSSLTFSDLLKKVSWLKHNLKIEEPNAETDLEENLARNLVDESSEESLGAEWDEEKSVEEEVHKKVFRNLNLKMPQDNSRMEKKAEAKGLLKAINKIQTDAVRRDADRETAENKRDARRQEEHKVVVDGQQDLAAQQQLLVEGQKVLADNQQVLGERLERYQQQYTRELSEQNARVKLVEEEVKDLKIVVEGLVEKKEEMEKLEKEVEELRKHALTEEQWKKL